ncbi:unnamed protein product [Fasciola hepatica]|uniref:Uncharacterized protein n=1 Tax=Fasciola hepatica TaxID=6192 RepID=A0ABC9HFT3_FASHE
MELNNFDFKAAQNPTRLDSLRKKWLLQQRRQSHDDNGLSNTPEDDDFSMTLLPTNIFYRQKLNKLNIPPRFSRSFDAERRCSNELQNTCGADVRLSNLVLHCLPDRRPSFIYRLETDDCYSVYSSRHTSITGDETLSE